MHASTCRRGLTLPRAAAEVSDSTYCCRAVGTLPRRVAITDHCSAVSGGIRSKTLRMAWIGEAITASDISGRTAAGIPSESDRRPREADTVGAWGSAARL